MSPPGRPKGESLRPQAEGSAMSPPGRPKGESLTAQPEGDPVTPIRRRNDQALQRAVQWAVLLRSGRGGSDTAARYRAWCGQHPSHQAACARVDQALGAMDALRGRGVGGAVACRTLAVASRRQAVRAALGVAGLGLGGGWLGWHVADSQGLLADQHTGVAQRHRESLPDGGLLWLDARTAVDVAFDPHKRRLTLHRGRVLVQAPAHAAGPLQLHTPLGTLQAGEARFVAHVRSGQRLDVTAINGPVRVTPPAGPGLELQEGRRAVLAAQQAAHVVAARGTETFWTRGLIAMDNEPLDHLVEALQDYRPGWLRVDARAAQLRISGVFSLDDAERTLQALVETQPIRVVTRTRYWAEIQSTG
jgi:transmembrane sensor